MRRIVVAASAADMSPGAPDKYFHPLPLVHGTATLTRESRTDEDGRYNVFRFQAALRALPPWMLGHIVLEIKDDTGYTRRIGTAAKPVRLQVQEWNPTTVSLEWTTP